MSANVNSARSGALDFATSTNSACVAGEFGKFVPPLKCLLPQGICDRLCR
jgi:hypothetical protein